MIKNDTILTNAKIIADAILCTKTPDRVAESVQDLLSFAADTQVLKSRPIAIATVEAILELIFQEATPEQVVL